MKVLIIGGLGFIGSQLARKYVEDGAYVTIYSRSKKRIANIKNIGDKVTLIIKDLKYIDTEVKDFDYIFNLAGSTDNYSIMEGDPYGDINLNCVNTISLLEACKKYNRNARIIFASTFFVNGHAEKLPVGPESKCMPLGLYGATRLAAEHFCHIYNNIFDLNVIITRFCNVFGILEMGDNKKKAGFNYMINQAVLGNELNLYDNGDFYRDYIYVTDVIDACQLIALKGKLNNVYYVGRGEFIKFKQLIDIIVEHTGVKVNPIEPPDFHKRVGMKDFVADVSELKKLGWEPKVSLIQGIKMTIDFYREYS